jgi:hypothetical protein
MSDYEDHDNTPEQEREEIATEARAAGIEEGCRAAVASGLGGCVDDALVAMIVEQGGAAVREMVSQRRDRKALDAILADLNVSPLATLVQRFELEIRDKGEDACFPGRAMLDPLRAMLKAMRSRLDNGGTGLERCDLCGHASGVGVCGACYEGITAFVEDSPKVRELAEIVSQGLGGDPRSMELADELLRSYEAVKDGIADDGETQAMIDSQSGPHPEGAN